jgi:hypothetical protein
MKQTLTSCANEVPSSPVCSCARFTLEAADMDLPSTLMSSDKLRETSSRSAAAAATATTPTTATTAARSHELCGGGWPCWCNSKDHIVLIHHDWQQGVVALEAVRVPVQDVTLLDVLVECHAVWRWLLVAEDRFLLALVVVTAVDPRRRVARVSRDCARWTDCSPPPYAACCGVHGLNCGHNGCQWTRGGWSDDYQVTNVCEEVDFVAQQAWCSTFPQGQALCRHHERSTCWRWRQ